MLHVSRGDVEETEVVCAPRALAFSARGAFCAGIDP